MHLHFLGGASAVGASCLLLEAGGQRVLIDAGVRLNDPDPLPDLARLQDLGGVDAIVITHAHADHIGALPLAAGAFPAAPVLATPATAALMAVMLQDAVRVGQIRAAEGGDLPAYGQGQVDALLGRIRPLPHGELAALLPGWSCSFWPAGHVLGAAMAWLDTPEGAVLISGDVSVSPQRTVGPAAPPRRRPAALVLESTYGNRLHSQRAAEEARLIEQVRTVLARGGHCLIPAFALGRAQEVLLVLSDARRRGLLPEETAVYVDGLVRAVCGVYTAHAASGTAALRRLAARQGNPFFDADGPVQPVTRPQQRQEILQGPPAVIVSSSGMLIGGPSRFYAAALAGNEQAAILITGYQDEESPGHRLLDLSRQTVGPRRLSLGDQEIELRCEVSRYNLSAHADGDQLAALAERLQPHTTLLVHGEAEARTALAEKLAQRNLPVRLPDDGASADLPSRRAGRRVAVVARPDPTLEDLVALARVAGRRPWTALDLADRHYGVATADGVAAIQALLASGGPFTPDRSRPGHYRLADREAPAPRAAETAWGQELVRQRLRAALGGEPDFVRASLYPKEHRAELRFQFPRTAGPRLADPLRALQQEMGWVLTLRTTPELGALQALAAAHLPPEVQPLGLPALHDQAGMVVVRVQGRAPLAPEAAAFRERTGYDLVLRGTVDEAATAPGPVLQPLAGAAAAGRLHQAAAIAAVKGALRAVGASVYHVAVRQGALEVTFLTPALGRRFEPAMAEIATRIGWPLGCAAHPQHAPLIGLVRQVIGRPILRGPGLHPGEERVQVRLAGAPSPEELADWQRRVLEASGYRLDVEVDAPAD